MRRPGAVLAVAVAVACSGGADEAGRDRPVGGAVGDGTEPTLIRECADPCPGIRLEHVGVLGSPADSVLLDWRSYLAAGDSFIAAGRVPVRGVVPLYDFDGRQVRVVGRYGGGPGEFRGPRPAPGLDGTIWVFDVGNQRVAVLGPGGSAIHEWRLYGGPHNAVPMDGRALVVGLLVSDSLEMTEYGPGAGNGAAIPPPFHFVGADGEILRSFGDWEGYPDPPAIAVTDTQSILTEVPGRYSVEHRDTAGNLEAVLERHAEWFVTGQEGVRNTIRSGISVMRVRGDHLWIRLAQPTEESRGYRLSGRPSLATMDTLYDTRIEVIDLTGPRVVASDVFDFPSLTFLDGSELLYSPRQRPDGYVVMDLWRAGIEDQRR